MKLFQKRKFHLDPLRDYKLENVFLLNVMQVKKEKNWEKKPAPPQNPKYMESAHEGNQRMQFDSSDNIPIINQNHLGFCFCLIWYEEWAQQDYYEPVQIKNITENLW